MKTTIDLPLNLLAEAQELLATTSKKETVIEALKRVIQFHKRQAIIENRGNINFQIDLDALRQR